MNDRNIQADHINSAEQEITDAIEITAQCDWYTAAPTELACSVLRVPGTEARLLLSKTVPTPLMNRVVGLPADTRLADNTLEWIKQIYRQSAISSFVISAWQMPGKSPLAMGLESQGLRADVCAHSIKFLHDMTYPLPLQEPLQSPAFHVRPAMAHEAVLVGKMICRSAEAPDAAMPWVAALVARPGWQIYLACDADDMPVATGALFTDGARAWLGMGTTLPEARQQGCQQILLAARLADARAAGCVMAAIETKGVPGGEASHSLNNIRRAGFSQTGLRINYVFQSA